MYFFFDSAKKKQVKITNLISGDFETDLSNFTPLSVTGTIEVSTSQKYTGNSSLKYAMSNNAGAQYIDITGNVGDKMYLCGMVNKQSGTATASALRMFDYGTTNAGYEVISANSVNSASNNWTFLSLVKAVAVGTTGIRVYIGSSIAQTVEYYLDSLCLINLTQDFGLTTPTKAAIDTFIQSKLGIGYFDTTKY